MKLQNLLIFCTTFALSTPIITKASIPTPTQNELICIEKLRDVIEFGMITCTKMGLPLTHIANVFIESDPTWSLERAFEKTSPFGRGWHKDKYRSLLSLFVNNTLSPLNQAIYIGEALYIFINNDNISVRAKQKFLRNIIITLDQLIDQANQQPLATQEHGDFSAQFGGYFSEQVAQ